ncbi:MAG: hypothetical protein IPP71_09950 [Bacteroidetes bacterium]|nr:hypothetical protein [Bacteroidota bacterium]
MIIPSDTTVCKGSGPISLIANPATGNWSWNGNLISTGIFNTSLTNQVQNYLVYTFGILTCEVRDSFLVTVIGANINAGNDTVLCSNSSPFYLNGVPTSGVWSGAGVVDSLTGYYDPSLTINSPDVVVYTYFEPISGCIVPDTMLVTVFSTYRRRIHYA